MVLAEVPCAACGVLCGGGGAAERKRCGACRAVTYCSFDCQKRHWAKHKRVCTKIAPAAQQQPMSEAAASGSPAPSARAASFVQSLTNMLPFCPRRSTSTDRRTASQSAAAPVTEATPCSPAAAARVFSAASKASEDALWHVVPFLDPIADFGPIAAVSTQLRQYSSNEDLWHAVLNNWSRRDANVESIVYTGRQRRGRPVVAHVRRALHANTRFYKFFASGELNCDGVKQMMGEEHTTVFHPSQRLLSHEPSMQSWHELLGRNTMACRRGGGGSMRVKCVRQNWRIDDNIAVIIGYEDFGNHVVAATNVFEMCKGRWRLIHHHGSHCPR
eukprot:TRINITY_DN39838_c0_g1_i1.p1 TRINITY_DN39838_c0_g1~~TRINITY_DN39838_c0_g1_i1.p1  ORF type:complete len:330 (+),score=47.88 TRINITY_DN39838_c0_g1_i1:55-1044(+)